MNNKINKIILLLFLSISLQSCFPTIFTAATATTLESAKDRSFGQTVDDIKISTKIKKDFITKGFSKLYAKITFEVVDGRVLLTGTLEEDEDIRKAVEIIWEIEGIKEVINELKADSESTKFNPKIYAVDSWITLRLKQALFFDKSIKFVNYTVITQNSVVYLFGIARNEEELKNVTDIASRIQGVEQVISYVKIKD